jgi:glycosyltransferase involved in cell wall biosynthesis
MSIGGGIMVRRDRVRVAIWHNLPSGGGKRQLHSHVRGLLSRGHHVEAWCPDSADRAFLPLGELIREHVLPLAPKVRPRWYDSVRPLWQVSEMMEALDRHYRQCAAEIAQLGFDVLYANACMFLRTCGLPQYLKLPSALYLGEPYRWFYEAMPELPWIAPRPLTASLNGAWRFIYNHGLLSGMRSQALTERDQARSFDRVLVNSLFSRENVLRIYNLESRVCRLGIDTGQHRPTGAPKEDFLIGVGTVYYGKGIDRALRAIAALPPARRLPLVWIANAVNPEEMGRVAELAGALGVALDVRVRVSDEEVVSLMSRARAMVYAPRLEPFGLAPLEANACGTAVVGIAEGGVRESIRDGVNGILVESDEPAAWADALGRLLDPATSVELGARARQHVIDHWGLERATDNIDAALCDVAARRA